MVPRTAVGPGPVRRRLVPPLPDVLFPRRLFYPPPACETHAKTLDTDVKNVVKARDTKTLKDTQAALAKKITDAKKLYDASKDKVMSLARAVTTLLSSTCLAVIFTADLYSSPLINARTPWNNQSRRRTR